MAAVSGWLMEVTPEHVNREHAWVRDRSRVVVPLINDVRADIGAAFETSVTDVSSDAYQDVVDDVFADGDVAVNVAALVAILRDLEVAGDYPGFVVDEVLGRELAATIAGGRPLSMLAQATFHYADIMHHGDPDDPAGQDDLDAALAAGFQTVLPGWDWLERQSPFGIE